MEKERAKRSVGCFAYERGFSPMFIAAAISVIAFLGVLGWRIENTGNNVSAVTQEIAPISTTIAIQPTVSVGDSVPSERTVISGDAALQNASTSSDAFSQLGADVMNKLLGAYVGLQGAGLYSTSTAQAAAQDALPLLHTNVPYTTYTPSDVKTDHDTSYARMLSYRSDLRTSLAPLLKNTRPEFELFGSYVETKDTKYLVELEVAAKNYRDAADATSKVVVPADASPYHVAILNAMQEFAAVLDAMSTQAADPFTAVALLRTYDQAESDMLTSFNALTTYYKSKKP